MRRILILFASFFLAAAAAVSQQASQPTTKKTQTAGSQAASEDAAEAEMRKTAQATIQWDQSSTPGMKADVELLKKADVNGHATVEYRLKISGAPQTQHYVLIGWPITFPNSIFMMDGLAIAKDGTVGCPADSTATCAQRIKGKELLLTYSPGLGEIYRHALISDDKKAKIFFSFVPFPLMDKDKSCSLEVVELKPGFGLVLVRGRGFQPGEQVQFRTESYQEVHNATVKADAHGGFEAPYTPWVKGHNMGESRLSATAKSCAPKISFNWGAGQ
jgi:hypothetical protein